MKRDLTELEISQLLQKQYYGHLGCCIDTKRPYVVPITYVYDKNAIISYSFEGSKIDLMRKQPHVCFQVEEHVSAESWTSAIVWGAFEELADQPRSDALSLLLERLWSESGRGHAPYFPFRNSALTMEAAMENKSVVLYRINIAERTGRMEEYDD